MSLNQRQREVLLRPVNVSRVAQRQGMSYLEAYDVRAHLIRVFGFGGFSAEASEAEMVAHVPPAEGSKNHLVCWKVKVTLTIHALGAVYSEYAIGSSQQPHLSEAMDMAIKTAESDALKRCATNLGDQFGLSLYNNGSLRPIVQQTLDADIDQPAQVQHITIEGPSEVQTPDHGPLVDALKDLSSKPSAAVTLTAIADWKAAHPAALGETVAFGGTSATVEAHLDQIASASIVGGRK